MKEQFLEDLHLNSKNEQQLIIINKIIEEYAKEGYILTLRQLFYQLVSRDIIPNSQKEYAKLSGLLVKGRMAGVVDWEAIEDRIRVPHLPYWVYDIKDALNDTIKQYRLNRQERQDVYIELWVEKDALSGVLKRITEEYHINLMVNRGYSSCSAMHDAYKRIRNIVDNKKKVVVLYLGDHDPSGLNMIRYIKYRFIEFGLNSDVNEGNLDADVIVKHIALTDEQVKQYNPPPNPAKFSYPRAKWYVEKYEKTSWEVDALNPKILNKLVKEEIESRIDMDLFDEQIEQERKDKEKLKQFIKQSEAKQ